ncbi:SDR family NAD(P)-dependent oxidoreductase [Hymenobacter sp. YC55]|uniref:SDR family oxidoreductase n=1 Tax=Hymenobacter sp. YC55 TaxID=3034019 RepID=UPI0023F90E2B|nr:SDR family NAD(P)-dependent oxidoreductase [Hymenobacter sp. YC55]MDF7813898.1 SDR family NAD(P)-dependent oxidoreductase [Hymenobacter sp. YC55]
MKLRNSTALITGGTSGIGLELVKQLSEQGVTLIVTGRSLDALHKTQKQFPGIHIIQSDVSNSQDIVQLYEEVTRRFPALNMIVNNAGLMRLLDLHDTTDSIDDVVQEITTNLSGTIQMVQQFMPHLKKQASAAIVNVSSAIAFMPYSSAPIYSASKAGVHAYTQALRLQLQQTNIKVFEVIPPGVSTNLQNNWVVQPNPAQMMSVVKMVDVIVKGLLKDALEIKPALVSVIKALSRVVPGLLMNFGHNEFSKFKKLAASH